MIGKSSFLCSKMTHTEFILIDDVGLSGTVRSPPPWEHFPPFCTFSLLYKGEGTQKRTSPFLSIGLFLLTGPRLCPWW